MITLDAIELPEETRWVDEFAWNPVVQNTDRSLTGALLVQEAALTYGRPITLQGGDVGWITRTDLLQLQAKVEQADSIMTLNYHGQQHSVIFDRSSGRPLQIDELYPVVEPTGDHFYHNLTIRLLTVEPPAP